MVLANISERNRLIDLVKKCSPILQIGDSGEYQGRVTFTNSEFRRRLFVVCHGIRDQSSSQQKGYHELVALRCYTYIKSWYRTTKKPTRLANVAASLLRAPSTRQSTNKDSLIDLDDGIDIEETISPQISSPDRVYPIKFLFRHLSEASQDAARALCDEDPGFWGQTSSLRDAWLKDFQILTNDLKNLSTDGFSALHVAAGIGANELVTELVNRHGHQSLSWTSDEGLTAVSYNDLTSGVVN